jgi:flagellar protein FlaG
MDVAPLHTAPQAAAPAAAPMPAEQQAENRQLIQAVHAINASEMFGQDSEITFSLDRRTQRAVMRLVDRKTKEVIRQIPAEHVLRMAELASQHP